MLTGDLVQVKSDSELIELGGHRYLDSKRYWWVSHIENSRTGSNEVYVVIEKNPRLYGPEAAQNRVNPFKRTAVIMDSSTRHFYFVPEREIKSINRVPSRNM